MGDDVGVGCVLVIVLGCRSWKMRRGDGGPLIVSTYFGAGGGGAGRRLLCLGSK